MQTAGELRRFLESVPPALLEDARTGDGAGVRVAVLDSGIEASHPDLRAPVGRSVFIDDLGRVADCPPVDPAGHGTACADIIGRLAPKCELWSVRVLDEKTKGSSKALIAALAWTIGEGADVINLSLGTREREMADPLRSLVDAAYRKKLLVVAAANNLPGIASYPAVFTSLVSVDAGSMDDREKLVYKLTTTSEIEAPGVYIEAAWPGGGRRLVTGTSFACPHVSGHIARILSRNPGMHPFQVKTVLYALGSQP
jgi:subtilisin family serine protease